VVEPLVVVLEDKKRVPRGELLRKTVNKKVSSRENNTTTTTIVTQ